MRRPILLALALLALSASSAATTAGADGLGPAPGYCTVPDAAGCVTKGGGGEVTISPHVVHSGREYTVTLHSIDGEYGGVAPGYGLTGPGCRGRIIDKDGDPFTVSKGLAGEASCTYTAGPATNMWQVVQIPFSVRYGGLGSEDGDFFAIVGRAPYVEGTVRDATGKGVPSAEVTIKGEGETAHATTNSTGYYEKQVAKGSFEVSVAKSGKTGTPATQHVKTDYERTRKADFTLDVVPGIKGTVTGRCPAGDEHCKPKGVANVVVTATDEATSKATTATTDKDGRYAILDLDPGDYRVGPTLAPGGKATPETQLAHVKQTTVDGKDFEVCVAPDSGKTEEAGGCGPKWDYTIDPRFSKTGEPTAKTASDFQPSSFPVHIVIEKGRCKAGSTFDVSVDGSGIPATKDSRCHYTLDLPREATYSVSVTEHEAGETDPSKAPAYTKDVVDQDFLIVTIGDSLSSGEGNPPFTDGTQISLCHRSKTAFDYQAAGKIEAEDPRSSVTFVHEACTGATTGSVAGELGTAGQIARVKQLIGNRHIDALEVSVGINDLDFGAVTTFCATRPDCWDEVYTGNSMMSMMQGRSTLTDYVESLRNQLPGAYANLAGQLKDSFPAAQLDPSDVYLTGYPTPFRDEHGKICASLIGTKRFGFSEGDGHEVSRAETRFFDPLLEYIKAAARDRDWHYVELPDDVFERHGVCSTDPWYKAFSESAANISGTLHPNAAGHRAMTKLLVSRYDDALLPDGKVRKP